MENHRQHRTSSPVPLDRCGLAAASDLLGDRWKLLILRDLFYGIRRFGDLQRDISIPRSILSQRLSELVADGILKRSEYREEGQRTRLEYDLTAKGADLLLPLLALWQWAEKHVEGKSAGLTLKQRTTGAELVVGFVPRGQRIPPGDVTYELAADKAD